MQIARAPQSIIGYHGCDLDVAERLLEGAPFQKSENDYDWLGSGAYFWEYAPFRAWDWARQRYGERGAVISAEISLGDCLNLLDNHHFADLQSVYEYFFQILTARGIPLPANSRGANRLDRMVIDKFSELYNRRGGYFDTVRGCFPEGIALYEGSQLLSRTHVQIAVRNLACIENVKLVHFE